MNAIQLDPFISNAKCCSIKVELVIFSTENTIIKDEIEEIIGRKADEYVQKGDIRKHGLVADSSWIYYDITGYLSTDDVTEAIETFMSLLDGRESELECYLAAHGLNIRIRFVIKHSKRWPLPTALFPSTFITLCARLNAEIDMDIY